MHGETVESHGIAGRAILLLVISALVIAVLSIYVIRTISNNTVSASYFAISSLLDADNFGFNAEIASMVTPFVGNFYLLLGTAILDGLAKAAIVGFILAAFINFITSLDLRATFGFSLSKSARGHTIICGYSMLAERLCRSLHEAKKRFFIIENNPQTIDMLRDLGYTAISGDFTNRHVLEEASIHSARAVVMATESDFTNLLGIVTARHMDPKVKIIARAREESSISKMRRAGADFCLVPEQVAGVEMGSRITGGA